jgi:hypothetical protein
MCVELMFKMMPVDGASGNVLTVTERTMSKVDGPPPLRAQNRSGLEAAFVVMKLPDAVKISNDRAWSAAGRVVSFLVFAPEPREEVATRADVPMPRDPP